jgi:putative sporulation protein YtaF
MYEIIILVLALCMDTFVASIAYGANKISISWIKIVAINGICSLCLGIALFAGSFIDRLIPGNVTKGAAFVCLLFLGIVRLMDYAIKKYINSHVSIHKDLTFSISGLSIIINIYGNPMAADWDQSKSLSWKEIVLLSFAMSIDSFVAGTLSGFLQIPVGMTVLVSMIMGIVVMYAGLFLGRKVAAEKNWDLSWLSGVLFMILAFSKL